MNSTDLAFTPALEQARLIRDKEISPLELVEVYLKRIEQLDGKLGSYVTIAAEQAISDAQAKTEALAGHPTDLPPLFGIPISIKDLNPVAGIPCTFGVKLLKNRIAEEDDGIVRCIKKAGCIILGKTATSELATLPYTEPDGFPPARNPWNLDYTPGGSSGGGAAAVAAGLCAIAQGSDGGGSIRGPAFCCGLIGIKPSRGRVTMAPFGDRLAGAAINGPLGRTVADAALLLDIMSGYVTGDPYWLPNPTPSFLAATQQPSEHLRIAFTTAVAPVGEADPICGQAVLNAVYLCEQLGHSIEPMQLDLTDLIEPFTIVWQSVVDEAGASIWELLRGEVRIPEFAMGKMNRWLFKRSGRCSVGKYLRAVATMQKIARQIVALFDTVDVLVLPTYMHLTIQVGEWASLSPAATLEKIIRWIAPCPPFNVSGQPAIAIPIGFAPNGLPIGVQLVGRPAAESTLISLATQLEKAIAWGQNRPAFANQQ